ncbi:hypothetical protein IWQ60_011055 [Tieghemiomyces parasiticus]|uniref:Uncharacterized protein n=1 Tax=Tieghemiomyces parasiticus TaxID=78921 RepID=A0A9W8DMR0_9FUNG|nr:hypothetical protein IWQ60_011055 [Tieghemiomyces parasiticus]
MPTSVPKDIRKNLPPKSPLKVANALESSIGSYFSTYDGTLTGYYRKYATSAPAKPTEGSSQGTADTEPTLTGPRLDLSERYPLIYGLGIDLDPTHAWFVQLAEQANPGVISDHVLSPRTITAWKSAMHDVILTLALANQPRLLTELRPQLLRAFEFWFAALKTLYPALETPFIALITGHDGESGRGGKLQVEHRPPLPISLPWVIEEEQLQDVRRQEVFYDKVSQSATEAEAHLCLFSEWLNPAHGEAEADMMDTGETPLKPLLEALCPIKAMSPAAVADVRRAAEYQLGFAELADHIRESVAGDEAAMSTDIGIQGPVTSQQTTLRMIDYIILHYRVPDCV